MTDYRKYTKSKIGGAKPKVQTPTTTNNVATPTVAQEVLDEARRCWENLESFRQKRQRCRMYTFGNQWGDRIYDSELREWITEEEYIKRQGKIPLKNNLIRQLVKSVLGQYRNDQTEPVCIARDRAEQQAGEMMSIAMQYNYQLNRMNELDARALEEFLISGIAVSKVSHGWKTGKDKEDVWTDLVNPSRLFFDTAMEDTRHWDCNLVGEVHDMKLEDVVAAFASSQKEVEAIEAEYQQSNLPLPRYALSAERIENIDFLSSNDGMCRIIEVWRRESKPRLRCHDLLKGEFYKEEVEMQASIDAENKKRLSEAAAYGVPEEEVPLIEAEWFTDRYWYYRFITPNGTVLREGESPYWHKEHPYSFKLYPFVDGEVHSFVADVIDQQRYINRLITMIDFIMGSSAKGVLLFPEESIPDGMTIEQVSDEWTRYNGVILCKTKPGMPLPQQISTNATNVGAFELLNIQLRLLDDISGVHGALQGKDPMSGTPASLYAQQSINSSVNLIDLLSSFRTFREERDTKCMKLIQQYYSEMRYLNIAGKHFSEESKMYNPDKVRNVEFDLTIAESSVSTAYRFKADAFLLELFKSGQINVEMLLENGSFPFSDRLLQSIRSAKEEAMQAQAATLPPEVMQQILTLNQGASPQDGAPILPQTTK